ncbi:ABC transporter ATP-binding protein [Emergencia timonensis]|uniref:ABC transporter ATP-binding protein n=1 Tax=Emergencia timonensis TaxID=1776384 RepID=UPI00241F3FC1|nr:ABC transporter ATP-binding protein [Emergencia timonensis]
MDNILEIKDLIVRYETEDGVVEAVNSVNLSLRQGAAVGLVGETGAGKTTLAKSILRLIQWPPGRIVSGQIFYNGKDLTAISEEEMCKIRGNDISMIFQDPMTSLNPVYSVGDQIAEVIHQHEKCSKEEGRRKAGDMLEMVGIPRARYDEYPHQFSGGMKQRVVIAMSIACSPELILADEPTTALDVTIQAQVLELMNELKEKLRTSLLLITHDLGVVAQVCDRVAIMYAGEIVESGTIAEVFDHPHHPYTIGLFGSIPSLDETAEKLKPIQGQMPDPTELPEGCAFAPRCPYATGACRTRKPEMTGVGGTQMVRCLAHQGVFESPELMEEVRHGR